MTTHYTEPTTHYWQRLVPASSITQIDPPFQYHYPAPLPNHKDNNDTHYLLLPIRPLPNNHSHAVASLLVNAASLDVVDTLAALLADKLKPYAPDIIVGLPTLGHALCPGVARGLGHSRYVPLGYSRKFWYTPTLSTTTSISSITSPAEPSPNQGPNQKRLWLDPHQLPLLLEGRRRVALIDDAVSSGSTLLAAWQLLETLGVDVVVCGVAMKQGSRWRETLGEERAGRLVGVFDSPLLEAVPQGWTYRT